jgi:hypothetical protein
LTPIKEARGDREPPDERSTCTGPNWSRTETNTGDPLVELARQLDGDFAEWHRALTFSEIAELRYYQGIGYLRVNPLLRDEIDPSEIDEGALALLPTHLRDG